MPRPPPPGTRPLQTIPHPWARRAGLVPGVARGGMVTRKIEPCIICSNCLHFNHRPQVWTQRSLLSQNANLWYKTGLLINKTPMWYGWEVIRVIVKNSSPQPTVGQLSLTCLPTVGWLSANCWPTVGWLKTNRLPAVGWQLIDSVEWSVCRLSTNCWWSVSNLSVICRRSVGMILLEILVYTALFITFNDMVWFPLYVHKINIPITQASCWCNSSFPWFTLCSNLL